MFTGLDHIAVVVPNTEAALSVWRDRLGFQVLFTETVNGEKVRLTHLDLGATQLQIVEPLVDDHPLSDWLRANGPGLHHLCLATPEVAAAGHALAEQGLVSENSALHQGTRGKRALFLDRQATGGVQVELTGA
jgi:methylmalonyl-CoA/ethylmalonyl-CoA epimerase